MKPISYKQEMGDTERICTRYVSEDMYQIVMYTPWGGTRTSFTELLFLDCFSTVPEFPHFP